MTGDRSFQLLFTYYIQFRYMAQMVLNYVVSDPKMIHSRKFDKSKIIAFSFTVLRFLLLITGITQDFPITGSDSWPSFMLIWESLVFIIFWTLENNGTVK